MNTSSIGIISEEDRNENNVLLDQLYKFKLEPSNVSETSQTGPQIILTDFTGNTVDGGGCMKPDGQYAPNGLSEANNNEHDGTTECSNRSARTDRRERNVCDNRVIVSQSAVSQKSIDLDISLRPIISSTADRDTGNLESVVPVATGTAASLPQTQQPCTSDGTGAPYGHDVTDTELVKRSMKLNLVDTSASIGNAREIGIPGDLIDAASSSTSVGGASAGTVVTTTAAIIMKHRKLKERTFSDEIGSPKSPAASGKGIVHCTLMIAHKITPTTQVEVVDDRKALRDALYQGIFHRHRRTIFAVGSFLRMLKSRNSSYNTIRSSSEGEDDTK
uniref:Uncharacterized protein n=1 Tax=Anopheles culicifacies TaxID=139723 RepID=A0A182M517_9DIPT